MILDEQAKNETSLEDDDYCLQEDSESDSFDDKRKTNDTSLNSSENNKNPEKIREDRGHECNPHIQKKIETEDSEGLHHNKKSNLFNEVIQNYIKKEPGRNSQPCFSLLEILEKTITSKNKKIRKTVI